jgi:membrane associated rhomboid family serine protease
MRPGFSDSPVECLQNNNGLGQPLCPLTEVCGFENFSNGQPNQWFRFITPIFLHAGVLHILFNLFSQLTLGGHLEKYWGPFRIFFIYFASGIGGFLFGGVYALPDLPSVGASGAIFGLVGCELVDLIQNWKYIGSPGCQLFKLVITIAINFALGLLPFIDNFSHIGGFIVGVLCSILIIPLPSRMPKKVILVKWTFMAAAFGVLVYLFYFGATGFYDDKTKDSCSWCKYLNCLPVFPICKNPTSPGNGL